MLRTASCEAERALLRIRLTSVPFAGGNARADDRSRISWIKPVWSRSTRVGKASHGDKQNYYAVDIDMPEGTPVLAARDGVVMTVDNDFYGAGLDLSQYGDRANNIRIAHSDGTMAVYAHLQLESAKVAVGDRVRAGQQLALSGDTGYTSGPHLHFCIQVNANMQIVSVPFNFSARGAAFQPEPGMMLGE